MNEIIEDIKKLAHKTHYYCEDSWYSCPLAEDGCSNDSRGKECDCGAEETNKKLRELFAALEIEIYNDKINHYDHVLQLAQKTKKELEDVLRWIPVTEQLPPDDTDVDFLCVSGYDGYGHVYRQDKKWHDEHIWPWLLPHNPTPKMMEYEGGPYNIGKDDFGNWGVTHWRLRPGTEPDFDKFIQDNGG